MQTQVTQTQVMQTQAMQTQAMLTQVMQTLQTPAEMLTHQIPVEMLIQATIRLEQAAMHPAPDVKIQHQEIHPEITQAI
jgi:hypothetical protein